VQNATVAQTATIRVAGIIVRMPKRNINLTDHFDRFVVQQISSGRYGNASEIVRALMDYAFKSFPLHRITASVDPRNAGSCRILEKTGFTKEAHFRQSEWLKGEWTDDAIYGLLRGEWEAKVGSGALSGFRLSQESPEKG
jgi:L-amino acid N-acyltransferase YncA